MSSAENDDVRSPDEILREMRKEGVRDNAGHLAQLRTELEVSLAVEADRVSNRNLTISQIACVVGVTALLILLLQMFKSSPAASPYQHDDAEYRRQMRVFNEHAEATSRQIARADKHFDMADRQAAQMDALLSKWEKQTAMKEEILEAILELLEKTKSSSASSPEPEAGAAEAPKPPM